MDIYYYNDLNKYDKYNPAFYLDRDIAREIAKYISKKPYEETIDTLKDIMTIEKEEISSIVDGLTLIGAITNRGNKLKINFPIFFKKDLKRIRKVINKEKRRIVDKISKILAVEKKYTKQELYHILCNDILDKYAIKYLSNKKKVTDKKIHPGGRDYIIIGYQKSRYTTKFSKKLLCSNNKYNCGKVIFNSFGDANGNRKDFFRYFRMLQMGKAVSKEIDECYSYFDRDEKRFKKELEKCILNKTGSKIAEKMLESINYKKNNKIIVPIIKKQEHIMLGGKIMEAIESDISLVFEKVKRLDISPNINEIPFEDTANEIWHILFGLINKELIKRGLVAKPNKFFSEGKYLKCIYLDE